MSTAWALLISLLLLAFNGFFVAAEFALLASKRYRLEQAAASGGRAARAALDGVRELTIMLAGAQLGITICTLGLGAFAEPAIGRLVRPILSLVGLSTGASHAVALVVALALVTFLHLVVGEMAPKSWAITDPERSALLLALPFRAFARVARPVLSALNGLANATLRLVRVRPGGRAGPGPWAGGTADAAGTVPRARSARRRPASDADQHAQTSGHQGRRRDGAGRDHRRGTARGHRRADRAGLPGKRPVPAGRVRRAGLGWRAWCTYGRRSGSRRPAGRRPRRS